MSSINTNNQTEENGTSKKIAFITGITGQDGSYLAEFLLSKNYEVHGLIRRSSSFNTGRIKHLYKNPKTHQMGCKCCSGATHLTNLACLAMKLHYGDMTDSTCLVKLIHDIRPDEIYNLAAQSHVKVSFDLSEYTANVDALGTLRLLDAIRTAKLATNDGDASVATTKVATTQVATTQVATTKVATTKFYQASTSELYGKVAEIPQRETTPFHPRSPYGVAKIYGYWIVVNYREAYNMFAVNGILFNHESPRRGETFVTRKITRGVAKISLGQQEVIELGNLDSKRDWGHARDYVEAMWLMLQQEQPEDFVIATGEAHSVREFVQLAFQFVGVTIIWEGKGLEEVGKDKETNAVRVKVNPKYFRPAEVDLLLGDASKAKQKLDWKPKTSFKDLVKEMVEADLQLMKTNPEA